MPKSIPRSQPKKAYFSVNAIWQKRSLLILNSCFGSATTTVAMMDVSKNSEIIIVIPMFASIADTKAFLHGEQPKVSCIQRIYIDEQGKKNEKGKRMLDLPRESPRFSSASTGSTERLVVAEGIEDALTLRSTTNLLTQIS